MHCQAQSFQAARLSLRSSAWACHARAVRSEPPQSCGLSRSLQRMCFWTELVAICLFQSMLYQRHGSQRHVLSGSYSIAVHACTVRLSLSRQPRFRFGALHSRATHALSGHSRPSHSLSDQCCAVMSGSHSLAARRAPVTSLRQSLIGLLPAAAARFGTERSEQLEV